MLILWFYVFSLIWHHIHINRHHELNFWFYYFRMITTHWNFIFNDKVISRFFWSKIFQNTNIELSKNIMSRQEKWKHKWMNEMIVSSNVEIKLHIDNLIRKLFTRRYLSAHVPVWEWKWWFDLKIISKFENPEDHRWYFSIFKKNDQKSYTRVDIDFESILTIKVSVDDYKSTSKTELLILNERSKSFDIWCELDWILTNFITNAKFYRELNIMFFHISYHIIFWTHKNILFKSTEKKNERNPWWWIWFIILHWKLQKQDIIRWSSWKSNDE